MTSTRRGLRRRLLTIAWPLIASNLAQTVLSLTDTLMVGHLGDERPLAALGHANVVFLIVFLVASAPFMGIQSLTARRIGEGRDRAAGAVLATGSVVAALLGLILGWAGWRFGPDIARLVAEERDLAEMAGDYLRVRWGGAVALSMIWAYRGFLYGLGRTRFELSVTLGLCVLNGLLNWVFIWGNLGAPVMGVEGAAIASVLATAAGAFMLFAYTLRREIRERFAPYRKDGLDRAVSLSIVRLSAPRAVQSAAFGGSIYFFHLIERSCGTVGLAASTIIWRFFGISVLVSISIGAAAATLVGQALGARDFSRARASAEAAVRFAIHANIAIGIAVFVFPASILGLFTDEPAVVDAGATSLRLVAIFMFVDGVGIVVGRVLAAAGQVLYVMSAEIVCSLVITMAAAYGAYHFFPGSVLAMWFTWVVYMVAWQVAMMAAYRNERWLTLKI